MMHGCLEFFWGRGRWFFNGGVMGAAQLIDSGGFKNIWGSKVDDFIVCSSEMVGLEILLFNSCIFEEFLK